MTDPYTPMADLTLAYQLGWGDTPGNEIPPDWRERMGPHPPHQGQGHIEDPARRQAHAELMRLRREQRQKPACNRLVMNARASRPRLARHWTDRRAAYLAGKLSA